MPPLRRSTRLARQVVEVDGTSYACFLYLIMIDVSMTGATVTPCFHRGSHRSCFLRYRTTTDQCGYFRAPFAVPAAAAIPNEDVTNREQRQQAIRDLEALLEPGAIEERITKYCRIFPSSIPTMMRVWTKRGAGHGLGHGLPYGLLYGLPMVRF
ncbi:hypothetical protein AWC38_SpisGene11417 [Stylophora pistillata]|uniref:Uncharacterized protein n=1 Tax=Stylophora pistillata TaxID=50429 RepID=A0A2B4S662_STYPI|nr:hypothetical protein AWC38_SpisGene11417 [Stylophora pistillata]